MDAGLPGIMTPSDEKAEDSTIKWYQQAIGSLLYATMQTRPDISYAISMLSRYCSNPGVEHLKALDRLFRYIKGSLDLGIYFQRDSDDEIIEWTDADYDSVIDGRKSTGGYMFMFNGGPISWAAKRQIAVALSSTESEYMAMTEAAKEAVWLHRLGVELKIRNDNQPMLLNADNQGAIALCTNPEFHRRTKHIW